MADDDDPDGSSKRKFSSKGGGSKILKDTLGNPMRNAVNPNTSSESDGSANFTGFNDTVIMLQVMNNPKLGFADGVSDGRESVFQKGFDQGYKDGLRTSFDLDKFRYFFKNLNLDKVKDADLHKEKQEYDKLEIKESKSQQHFQYLKHQDQHLDVISAKQHEYLDEMMHEFKQKLPKASDLLIAHSQTDFM